MGLGGMGGEVVLGKFTCDTRTCYLITATTEFYSLLLFLLAQFTCVVGHCSVSGSTILTEIIAAAAAAATIAAVITTITTSVTSNHHRVIEAGRKARHNG